jgi:hypothetical protein
MTQATPTSPLTHADAAILKLEAEIVPLIERIDDCRCDDEGDAATDTASQALADATAAMMAIRATTLDGLCAKARVATYDPASMHLELAANIVADLVAMENRP